MTEPDPRGCPLCTKPLRGDGCCILCPTLRYGKRVYHVDSPAACPSCRLLLAKIPDEIAGAYELLPELVAPGAHGSDGRSKNPEAPLPFTVDPLDLTADWTVPRGPLRRARLAANADLQEGFVPVRSTLITWIRDFAERHGVGENGPDDDVKSMCDWLRERTEWACSEHPALDSYAQELTELRGKLLAMAGREEVCPDCGGKGCETCQDRGMVPPPWPTPLEGQPCPRCDYVGTLVRRADGDTACEHPTCGTVWRPDEWERLTRAKADAALRTHRRLPDGTWVPKEG